MSLSHFSLLVFEKQVSNILKTKTVLSAIAVVFDNLYRLNYYKYNVCPYYPFPL